MFFKQRDARLFNGQTVRCGDKVRFLNSDKQECVGCIKYDINNPKKLYFWNNGFEIQDYRNAEKV